MTYVPPPIVCSIDGCEKKTIARGWCSAHYARYQRHGDPISGRAPMPARLSFMQLAIGYTGDDCLIWPFGRDDQGYARLGYGKSANRAVCEAAHGAPPRSEHQAAHLCGNGHKGCISANHLAWKTRVDNEADKLIHGTHIRGDRHPLSKLSEADVMAIRLMSGAMRHPEIAEKYNVSRSLIGLIVSRKRWGWVKESGVDL